YHRRRRRSRQRGRRLESARRPSHGVRDIGSPFISILPVCPGRSGTDSLSVVVGAAVSLQPRIALAPEQLPPVMADEYYADPGSSSLKAVSELHIGKPGTDIVITGHARAPRPTTEMAVLVSVAERQTSLRVLGDRVWRGDGTATAPEPFTEMPLVWERAYGGRYAVGGRGMAAERNPLRGGFLGVRDPAGAG